MNAEQKKIREKLGHFKMEWNPTYHLNTGNADLNEVLGDRDLGLAFGNIIEITGWESQGKSALFLAIAALAQRQKALVIWEDVENSWNRKWALQRGMLKCPKCVDGISGGTPEKPIYCGKCGGKDSPTRGMDNDALFLVRPYVGHFMYLGRDGKMHKEKEPRYTNAEELCSEAEQAMALPTHDRKILVLDSVAALLTAGEAKAGIEKQNMRTKMDLPLFMGGLLRRWVGLAQVHNALIVLVNQLREGPKTGFGDSTTSPGGNAPRFYSQVRVRVNRVKGGKIVDKGKLVGITGVMRSLKNKAGGTEGMTVGYKIHFKGPIEFVPAKSVVESE